MHAKQALEPASKPAASNLTELAVSGMTCSNCARHVTEALQDLPNVASAGVQLEKGTATVRWRSQPDIPAAIKAVTDAGYEAKVAPQGSATEKTNVWSPLTSWRATAIIGLICLVPLMAGEWLFHLAMERWFQWLGFGLASIVQVFCGARFYRGAWNQLKIGSSNMDSLVALGSTTAYLFSVWVLFSGQPQHVYFMEAAGIITLISVGHWMEARAGARASSALEGLLKLAPQTARVRDPLSGTEKQVPVSELQEKNLVILKPGDRVPIDGIVTEGASAVDESMLTGESLPVDKKPGDAIYAGTVNVNGQITLRVTATGEETALAGVIAAVQRAQTSRANIQRLGDRVSSVFVPVVVVIAVATALWWGLNYDQAQSLHHFLAPGFWMVHLPDTATAAAFICAAAVLIVACPCAMGLATPVAIMAGTNAAAKRGILIRDGIALEKAGTITAVLFDKTGTLTAGKPTVAEAKVLQKLSGEPEFEIQILSALARRSNHPLSQAVAKLASRDFAFDHWQEVRGAGVQAEFTVSDKSRLLRMGSIAWLNEKGVAINPAKNFSEEWMARGATILGFACDQQLIALLALQDTLKPGADAVIHELTSKNLRAYLITGDNKQTAHAIAEKVGIPRENVFAEVRPEQKAILVKELQQRGEKIAFVGDGINDAPALEQADLGIAVSKASDIAHEASDIILLNSDIHAIPETLALASATLRTIKQNLFWAFFYNAAAIPLAALGFMSPLLCAAAMGLSDLVVIGNALRLRHRNFRATSR
jgi:Cu+-exporting ATPase